MNIRFWRLLIISDIIFMINELHLLWVPNFIALGIYFLFGIKFSWKEETGTCFDVECVLLGRNFDFLGGYLVVTARYLIMVTTGYTRGFCSLPSGYCSFPLLVWAAYLTLFFNCKICHTFSLTKHEASVVVPYFLRSSKKKKMLWADYDQNQQTKCCLYDQDLDLHIYVQTVLYHYH